MTNGEAFAVNVLIQALFDVTNVMCPTGPSDEKVRSEAAWLAERARRQVGVGFPAADVRLAPWRHR